MSWNYRVVKQTCGVVDGYVLSIYEVYCNSDDEMSWTVGHKAPIGSSLDELRADLKMMLKALDLPVLEEKGDTLVEVK
ncbi:hypothetical protein KAI30_00515 [Candidatus Bathyarchaeota archaeon]|nr:hypothetical protein [Candidatus Bathyarchaeota archaeon]